MVVIMMFVVCSNDEKIMESIFKMVVLIVKLLEFGGVLSRVIDFEIIMGNKVIINGFVKIIVCVL